MNVHIVCDYLGDRILPRLARILAQETGWSSGETPRYDVELNHFLCYIDYAQRFEGWHKTLVTAWFTHYEHGAALKERWWDVAARNVDLRLTSARQYLGLLQSYGLSQIVIPPIDQSLFVPIGEIPHKRIVGLSGFVCPGGRKGEHLVGRLVQERQDLDIRATGRGWPVHKQSQRKISELPAFYQSLDVYLCTASIEGIPMPPLEALSCGVPIVIPRGVGLLDDLPDINGIYRYSTGCYEEMMGAIDKALLYTGSREPLRKGIAKYTAAAWADGHKEAFESLLYPRERTGKRGVYFVAFGKPARRYATEAIWSFKELMSEEIALVSDKSLGPEDVFIQHDDVDIGGRHTKTKIYDLAPDDWEYILYLDADTRVIADISFLYQLLEDGWDMVVCKNPERFHIAVNMVREDNKEECRKTFRQLGTQEIMQLNGGVLAFRRNYRTERFFHAWHEEWQRWGKRDQAALLRALFNNPVKLYVLGSEWNTITRYMDASRSAGILHFPMRARRWKGIIQGRLDSKEAWKAVGKK